MLKITGIKKSFGNVEVLKSIDLNVDEGEIVVLVGPSGGGKTTLLRIINMLEKCDDGTIVINNNKLCENGKYTNKEIMKTIRKDVGLVFQNFNLFPHMTVMENIIEAPIKVLGLKREEASKKAEEILGFLELKNKKSNYAYELSGGQKQRVAIARALAMNPKLMCFDEPTSALDPKLTEDVANTIKLLRNKGMTMFIITHDMNFAEMVADRIVSIDKGKIINRKIFTNN